MAKLLKKSKVYCVIGGPGAGKGTTGKKLASECGLTHFSTGELLRKEIQGETETGQKVKAAVDRGELVPTPTVIQLLKENMIKEAATSKGFIIDGYPRDVAQCTLFEKEIAPIIKVIHLKATDDTMKARSLERAATEGRSDDTEEVIAARIATHNMNLKPITEYCTKKKKLVEIDAEAEPEEVFSQCKIAIEKKK